MSDFAPFIAGAQATIVTETEAANALAEKLIHTDNAFKAIYEVRDETVTADENINKYRIYVADLEAKMEAAAKQIEDYIVAQGLVDTAPIDKDAVTAEYKAIAARVKGMVTVLSTIPGGSEVLPQLPELKSIPGTRTGRAGAGAGTPKLRLASITCDGTDVYQDVTDAKTSEVKRTVTLSILAAKLSKENSVKVEPKDLIAALFAAAGTQDMSTLAGKPVEFFFEVTSKDGVSKNYALTVTPAAKA